MRGKTNTSAGGDNTCIIRDMMEAVWGTPVVIFEGVPASFVESTANVEYPYEAHIQCEDVTEDMMADVVFSSEQAVGDTYAPYCDTCSDEVIIYSKMNEDITVDVVVFV